MSVETVKAEVVVVGGGMVGLASAIALRDRGLDVLLAVDREQLAVVERRTPPSPFQGATVVRLDEHPVAAGPEGRSAQG